jgi:hypothetical protein
MTFGGFDSYQSFGTSYNYGQPNFMDSFNNVQDNSKTLYFDALLNSNFEFVKNTQTPPLAIDNLNYYRRNMRNNTVTNVLKLKDFYILGYYEQGTQAYVMRKFTDGFMDLDPGNPIMNKASFSKSIPLKRN